MKILLFDMDGVLVEPRGYHEALIATVAQVSGALGFGEVRLSLDEIAGFEACGVTSEWDSAAICAALLLVEGWRIDPELSLPAEPPLQPRPPHGLPVPDWASFMESVAAATGKSAGERPLARAERLLLERTILRDQQQRTIIDLLRGARQMGGSVTHRIFQELALGEQRFERAYGCKPALRSRSFLLTYDRPGLSPAARQRLREKLVDGTLAASVFTSRPSLDPEGRGVPEAELGAEVAGLPALPIVGLGGLHWLAIRRGVAAEQLLKPSSVHALAALAVALGDSPGEALNAAADLALLGAPHPSWRKLESAQVVVLEDSANGIQSALAASECLGRIGVNAELTLCGVTADGRKRLALESAGATVSASLEEALARFGI